MGDMVHCGLIRPTVFLLFLLVLSSSCLAPSCFNVSFFFGVDFYQSTNVKGDTSKEEIMVISGCFLICLKLYPFKPVGFILCECDMIVIEISSREIAKEQCKTDLLSEVECFICIGFLFVARLPKGFQLCLAKIWALKICCCIDASFSFLHLHIISKPLEEQITVFPSMVFKKQIIFCVSFFFLFNQADVL